MWRSYIVDVLPFEFLIGTVNRPVLKLTAMELKNQVFACGLRNIINSFIVVRQRRGNRYRESKNGVFLGDS